MPVKTIAMPCASAAASPSASRIEPPGGTTERAIGILEDGGLRDLVNRALTAARDRSLAEAERDLRAGRHDHGSRDARPAATIPTTTASPCRIPVATSTACPMVWP